MNPSQLITSTFEAHVQDERRHADASRRAGQARPRRRFARRAPQDPGAYVEHVVIRSARVSDSSALHELAELDSGRVPAGDSLVAEIGGRVVAAVDVANGRVLADPFVPTADIVALLQMRLRQLAGVSGGRSMFAALTGQARQFARIMPGQTGALGGR